MEKNIFDNKSIRKSEEESSSDVHYEKKKDRLSGMATKEKLDSVKIRIQASLEKLQSKINEGTCQIIKNDQIIKQLGEIKKEAQLYRLENLEKKIVQAIGHRILHLEIQNRQIESEKKKIKKEEMEQSFFRYKKIKKFDYDSLIKHKLTTNSYIARSYSSGKGFIESDNCYRQLDDFHLQRLEDCQFLEVIKAVNRIYMENYSHYSTQSGKQFSNQIPINVAYFLCLVLIVLGALILETNIDHMQEAIGATVLGIVVILLIFSVRAFLMKPNSNNQLEQTKCDIKIFFQKLNKNNQRMGRMFEWKFPDSFMYLQVHFSE